MHQGARHAGTIGLPVIADFSEGIERVNRPPGVCTGAVKIEIPQLQAGLQLTAIDRADIAEQIGDVLTGRRAVAKTLVKLVIGINGNARRVGRGIQFQRRRCACGGRRRRGEGREALVC